MLCPECKWDNPAKQMFCNNCGCRLELDFEEVQEVFGQEIQAEREQTTNEQVYHFLSMAIFAMVILIIFRSCVAANPPKPRVLPYLKSPVDTVPTVESEPINPLFPMSIPYWQE